MSCEYQVYTVSRETSLRTGPICEHIYVQSYLGVQIPDNLQLKCIHNARLVVSYVYCTRRTVNAWYSNDFVINVQMG